MKDSAKYAKIVEWSDEDQCYIGSAPGLIFGGCHGDDEKEVFNPDSAVEMDIYTGQAVSLEERRHRSEQFQCRLWCLIQGQ